MLLHVLGLACDKVMSIALEMLSEAPVHSLNKPSIKRESLCYTYIHYTYIRQLKVMVQCLLINNS